MAAGDKGKAPAHTNTTIAPGEHEMDHSNVPNELIAATAADLDGLLDGAGFAVAPRHDCVHCGGRDADPAAKDKLCVSVPTLGVSDYAQQRIAATRTLAAHCQGCDIDAGENWVCTQCWTVRCSRYMNGCMAAHCGEGSNDTNDNDNTHPCCVAVSLADLSAWCFRCDAYVDSLHLRTIISVLHDAKFGAPAQGDATHTVITF